MSPAHPTSSPSHEEVRGALRALGAEAPPGEREFAARRHRRLAAAGPPPAVTWLDNLLDDARESWRDRQRRSLLTGALVGALVTATVFTLLAGARPRARGDGALVFSPGVAPAIRSLDRPSARPDHKASHALGDHRSLRLIAFGA